MSNNGTVLFPNNFLKIPVNIRDSIIVDYTTKWPLTNLTLLCRGATAQFYSFYNMPENPIQPSGTYVTPDFQTMNVSIAQYPAECVFRLTKYGQSGGEVDSTLFTLTSSADASPRTFGISTTIGLSKSTTAASPETSIPASITTTSNGSQLPQRTGFDSSSSTPSNPPSSGLNQSTSIAIGVAVGLGVALIMTIAAIWFLYKRRKQRSQLLSPDGKFAHGKRFEKQELDGIGIQYPAVGFGDQKYPPPLPPVEKDGTAMNVELEGSQYKHRYSQKGVSGQEANLRHELA